MQSLIENCNNLRTNLININEHYVEHKSLETIRFYCVKSLGFNVKVTIKTAI